MKKGNILGIVVAFFFSALAVAETVTFPVQGMHCDGCVKTVTGGVCDVLKGEVKSCQVRLVDPTAEKGEIKIETLPGKKLDRQRVAHLVSDTGYQLDETSTPKK